MLEKIKRNLYDFSRLGDAFGYGFTFRCFWRRVISFRKYESYMYRYLTSYFAPVIEQIHNRVYEFEQSQKTQKKYIWSLWWQGEENAPEIVKVCIASQRKMLVRDGIEYHVLTKDNWMKFIELPTEMLEMVDNGKITLTHFSDIIRAELIRRYGGIWIDATVYCVRPQNLFNRKNDFFTIKAHDSSDYLTLKRWTGFFVGDKQNSLLFEFIAEAFRFYWAREKQLIVYLLIDYLIAIAYEQFPEVKRQVDEVEISNREIWSMLRCLNKEYDEAEWHEKTSDTSFFKLSYKDEFNGGALKEMNGDRGMITYWGMLRRNWCLDNSKTEG